MLPYWLLYLLTALPAAYATGSVQERNSRWGAFCLAVAVALLIGLRYQVGADWYAYLRIFDDVRYVDLGDVPVGGDPAFTAINWVVSKAGIGYWLVNLICGVLFTYGLFRFTFNLPNPWLGLAVATPYLVIVVAMGYSRQGVAIGLVLLGLVAVKRHDFLKFVFWTLAAAAFHKSAIVVLPVVALAYSRNRVLVVLSAAIFTVVGYYLFVASAMDTLIATYVDYTYESQGAAIRIFMNAIPAAIFLLTIRRYQIPVSERNMWRNFSIIAIVSVFLVLQVESTTALDRIALYLIPIQLFVFSWLPLCFANEDGSPDRRVVALILIYSAAVLYIWLNYATHADSWIPYQIYPLTE